MMKTRSEQFYLLMAGVSLLVFGVYFILNFRALPHGGQLWPIAGLAILFAAFIFWGQARSSAFRRRVGNPRPLLFDRIPAKEGHFYIGHGFEWKRHHLELFYEAEQSGVEVPPNDLKGNWLIHAVGGRSRPIWIRSENLNQHKFVISTTGGGKTRVLELDIEQAIRLGHGVVVLDPKGDSRLLARAQQVAAEMGAEFELLALPYPSISRRYNPLGRYRKAHEIADAFFQTLPSKGEAEAFAAYGWGVIHAIAGAMILAEDTPITLSKIKHYAFGGTWDLFEKVLRRVLDPRVFRGIADQLREYRLVATDARSLGSIEAWYGHLKRSGIIKESSRLPNLDQLDELMTNLILHPKEHYQKMVANLWPKLSMLTTDHLRELLSPEEDRLGDISWDRLDKGKQVVVYIYLGSLLGYTTANMVAGMTVLDLISYVGHRYAFGDPSEVARRPLSIVIDELPDVIQPAFINLLNKSRGANVNLIMAVQTFHDLAARLNSRDEAMRVPANVSTYLQMPVKVESDAKAFSTMTGVVSYRSFEESAQYEPALGEAGMRSVSGHRASYSQSWKSNKSELVPTHLIQNLCRGHFFVMVGGRVIKGVVPLLPDPPPSIIDRIKEAGFRQEPLAAR